MNKYKKIGIGVIGCGSIAREAHLPSYIKIPECKIIAVADSKIENAKNLAYKYKINHVYDDYKDLLENSEIDAVSICTPPKTHCKIAVDACKKNKHVLCEKPIALSLSDADMIINSAEKYGVILAIGHQLRFVPSIKEAFKLIRKKEIGKILTCYGEFSGGGPFYGWKTSSNYYLEPGSGVDILYNYGTHMFDAFNFLFKKAINVSGLIKKIDINNVKIDDRAIVSIEYEDDILAVLNTSYTNSPDPNMAFIDIQGLEGKIEIYLYRPTITLYKKDSFLSKIHGKREFIFGKMDYLTPYLLEIRDFIMSIINKKEPTVTGRDGRKALEIALAAYNSNKSNRIVSLPLKKTIIH